MEYPEIGNYATILINWDEAFSIAIQHLMIPRDPRRPAQPVGSNILIRSENELRTLLQSLGVNAVQKPMHEEGVSCFKVVRSTLNECLDWLAEAKRCGCHSVALIALNVSEEEIQRRLNKWHRAPRSE
jgi:hypothetical protein